MPQPTVHDPQNAIKARAQAPKSQELNLVCRRFVECCQQNDVYSALPFWKKMANATNGDLDNPLYNDVPVDPIPNALYNELLRMECLLRFEETTEKDAQKLEPHIICLVALLPLSSYLEHTEIEENVRPLLQELVRWDMIDSVHHVLNAYTDQTFAHFNDPVWDMDLLELTLSSSANFEKDEGLIYFLDKHTDPNNLPAWCQYVLKEGECTLLEWAKKMEMPELASRASKQDILESVEVPLNGKPPKIM